jgi:hypothetical protein
VPRKTSSFKKHTNPDDRNRQLRAWLGDDSEKIVRTLYNMADVEIDGTTREEEELTAFGLEAYAAQLAEHAVVVEAEAEVHRAEIAKAAGERYRSLDPS